MKTLDKYIGKTVLSGILIVLLILVGLFTFFEFIDEIDDIGKERYGLLQAIQYVALEIPIFIYNLFPYAALLGSLLGLGMLANNSELTVMRATGISTVRIVISILKVGLVLTILVMLIGEFVAPKTGQYANNMRAIAQSEHERQRMVFLTRYGFWSRDKQDFINIRTIYPDGGFGGITLYEFDSKQNLKSITKAKNAFYEKGKWFLKDVEKHIIEATQVTRQYLDTVVWKAILSPELVKIVVIRPNKLSSLGLYKYIQYLHKNGQRTAKYELAFWTRLGYPLVCITMIFLATPFVFGSLRTVSVGQRVLVGALIGVVFHMLNQTMGNMGLVYNLYPAVSALLPPILFLAVTITLMRRII
ncbi:LPS export ABC transporter permease LptG [Candidatus Halobeggiatoa sp. HSG11]|nr:LPS export ABC transporter permease LptG [Candidatus Halobeggiatoa sp. HSG11]